MQPYSSELKPAELLVQDSAWAAFAPSSDTGFDQLRDHLEQEEDVLSPLEGRAQQSGEGHDYLVNDKNMVKGHLHARAGNRQMLESDHDTVTGKGAPRETEAIQ